MSNFSRVVPLSSRNKVSPSSNVPSHLYQSHLYQSHLYQVHLCQTHFYHPPKMVPQTGRRGTVYHSGLRPSLLSLHFSVGSGPVVQITFVQMSFVKTKVWLTDKKKQHKHQGKKSIDGILSLQLELRLELGLRLRLIKNSRLIGKIKSNSSFFGVTYDQVSVNGYNIGTNSEKNISQSKNLLFDGFIGLVGLNQLSSNFHMISTYSGHATCEHALFWVK